MIFVDKNTGSKDLIPLLEKRRLPVQGAWLKTADVEFAGRGVKGEPVQIGIEIKQLSELTGDWDRFAGEQVPKMQAPQYDHRWLVHEGEWHQDRHGHLIKKSWAGRRAPVARPHHGQNDAGALRKKLLTLEMCAGFHRIATASRFETVQWIEALYRFWTDDDLDEHKSHLVVYTPQGLVPLTQYQKAFAAWPDLSSVRCRAVARRFKNSIVAATRASVEEWAAIEIPGKSGTRRLGTKVATSLVEFLHGRR